MDDVRSIVASRSWRDGSVVDDDVPLEEIPGAVRDPAGLVWIDLLCPTPEELGAIPAELGIPATAVEDALAPFQRPKMARYDTHLFFTATPPGWHPRTRTPRGRAGAGPPGSQGSSLRKPW